VKGYVGGIISDGACDVAGAGTVSDGACGVASAGTIATSGSKTVNNGSSIPRILLLSR
jgi:hypothetical protein